MAKKMTTLRQGWIDPISHLTADSWAHFMDTQQGADIHGKNSVFSVYLKLPSLDISWKDFLWYLNIWFHETYILNYTIEHTASVKYQSPWDFRSESFGINPLYQGLCEESVPHALRLNTSNHLGEQIQWDKTEIVRVFLIGWAHYPWQMEKCIW